LDQADFPGASQSRAKRFGGLAAVRVDADPGPDRRGAGLEGRANDVRFIDPKESVMFLLDLSVHGQGLGLGPVTNELDDPTGRRFRLHNDGRRLRLCNQFRGLSA
jgi:hypothetical protein